MLTYAARANVLIFASLLGQANGPTRADVPLVSTLKDTLQVVADFVA